MTKEELSRAYTHKKVEEKIVSDISEFMPSDIIQAYEDGFNKAVELACAFLKDRIEHDSIDYPMATMYLINDLKRYVKGIEL